MYGEAAIFLATSSMRSTRRAAASRLSAAMYAKFHQGRRARRVRIGASCASIATEHLLHLFIGRQVSPRRARFDDLPFFISDLIVCAPLFNLADDHRQLLLVGRRPTQHAIENLFHLISGHVESIAHGPFNARRRSVPTARSRTRGGYTSTPCVE